MGFFPIRKQFSAEVDRYTILLLKMSKYCDKGRKLPEGFRFATMEEARNFRVQEKNLLIRVFDDWHIPYFRRLPGLCQDSAVFVVNGSKLAGGVYISDKNCFDEDHRVGQLHYPFIHGKFKGLGIYSVVFQEAIRRALSWGLEGLYVNTDRHLHPEIYIRWGAEICKVTPKKHPTGLRRIFQFLSPYWRSNRRKVRVLLSKLCM